jgi:hypothetical protein
VYLLLAWGELLIRMVEAVDTTGARAFDLETSEDQPLAWPPGVPLRRLSSQCWVCLMTEFSHRSWTWPTLNVVFRYETKFFKSWRKIQVFLKFHDSHSSPYCYEEQISAMQISKLNLFLVSSLFSFPSE